jgi:hypothetical protein
VAFFQELELGKCDGVGESSFFYFYVSFGLFYYCLGERKEEFIPLIFPSSSRKLLF